jgi:hypothetical protein
VIQSKPGRDPPGNQPVDELVVEGDTGLVHRVISSTEWDDAGPWERKPVRFRAVLGEKIKVLLVSVVVVAGDIAVSPIRTRWFQVGEGIPDARSPPIFISSAFDLVGSRCKPSDFPLKV